MNEIAPGISHWTAPHPEWRTRDPWGHRVASYALVDRRGLSLVDPLLPPEDTAERARVQARLDELVEAAPRLDILITIPYHTRSAEPLFHRYRTRLPVRIWGAPGVRTRFQSSVTPLTSLQPGDTAGTSAVALAIGKPRRSEMPLYFAAHRALALGDVMVNYAGAVRIWQPPPFTERWYREAFLPSLHPLLTLDVERILVTHGEPVLSSGAAALAAAVQMPPWSGPHG